MAKRELDEATQFDKSTKEGKAPPIWEKGEAYLEFFVNDKIYHINIYKELLLDAEDTLSMNKIAFTSCSDGIYWCGIARRAKSKLDIFQEIDLKKWKSHVYKYAKWMCYGEHIKAKPAAADVENQIIIAFSEDLVPEDKSIESLKKNVAWYVELVIKGMFPERDFSKLPITSNELDNYFGMIYLDVYDLREVNFESTKKYLIKLEEINEMLDWVRKIMADKKITLISTISNNIRSEQNIFGKEISNESIKSFNKSILNDEEFRKLLKDAIKQEIKI